MTNGNSFINNYQLLNDKCKNKNTMSDLAIVSYEYIN